LSPGGEALAYEQTGLPGSGLPDLPRVWILPLAVTGEAAALEAQPVQLGPPDHQISLPVWSSQGVLSVYDTTEAAFIFLDPLAGELARLPNQTGQPGAWNPSGDAFIAPEIFFLDANVDSDVQGLERLADSHLIQFDWRNNQSRDLTAIQGLEDAAPVFSPDGRFLAFGRKYLDARNWTPGRQVWLLDMDTQQQQQLTRDPLYNHFDFAWNPDGDRLALVRFNQSSPTDPPEIWMVDLLAGQAVQLASGGYAPQWIP
jgi:hypothetical protein